MARILIADDSGFVRTMLRKVLESAGHEIVGEALDGQQAVDLYRRIGPDVVTMDLQMPVLDGIEAITVIRGLDPTAKIVVVTALGQRSASEAALRAGASGIIIKPFEPGQIHEAVAQLMR